MSCNMQLFLRYSVFAVLDPNCVDVTLMLAEIWKLVLSGEDLPMAAGAWYWSAIPQMPLATPINSPIRTSICVVAKRGTTSICGWLEVGLFVLNLSQEVRLLRIYLATHLRKIKKQQTASKGGWIFWATGGKWGRPGAPQPSAEPPTPYSANPKISAFFNLASASSRSTYCKNTMPQDQLSAAQEKHKGICTLLRSLRNLHTSSFWEWVAASTTIILKSLLRSWGLILKEFRNLLPSFICISVDYAAKLVHTRCALSSTFIWKKRKTAKIV